MTRICLFGAGQMGTALLGGLLEALDASPSEFAVFDPQPQARAEIERRYPGVVGTDVAISADGAILAMKPKDVKAACKAIPAGFYQRVLSIAAGVTLSSLEEWLWPNARVIRAMPNTPALVRAGASAIAPGRNADDGDLAWAESILGAVGLVVRVGEPDLDAVTGLSGSGPAYLFYLAEALIAAGVESGLDEEVSRRLTNQTLLGASHMLDETKRPASELRAAVTSPGGTTAAAIEELDHHNFVLAVQSAVRRAVERSRELGASS